LQQPQKNIQDKQQKQKGARYRSFLFLVTSNEALLITKIGDVNIFTREDASTDNKKALEIPRLFCCMLCVAIIIWRSRDGIYFITIMNSYIFTTIHFLNTNKNTIKIHFHPELPRDYAAQVYRDGFTSLVGT